MLGLHRAKHFTLRFLPSGGFTAVSTCCAFTAPLLPMSSLVPCSRMYDSHLCNRGPASTMAHWRDWQHLSDANTHGLLLTSREATQTLSEDVNCAFTLVVSLASCPAAPCSAPMFAVSLPAWPVLPAASCSPSPCAAMSSYTSINSGCRQACFVCDQKRCAIGCTAGTPG